MKKQILTLIIGILIGAIITAGVFLIFQKNSGDITQGGGMGIGNMTEMGDPPDGNMTMDGTRPELPNSDSNDSSTSTNTTDSNT